MKKWLLNRQVSQDVGIRDCFPSIQRQGGLIQGIAIISVDLAKKDIFDVVHEKGIESAMDPKTLKTC